MMWWEMPRSDKEKLKVCALDTEGNQSNKKYSLDVQRNKGAKPKHNQHSELQKKQTTKN